MDIDLLLLCSSHIGATSFQRQLHVIQAAHQMLEPPLFLHRHPVATPVTFQKRGSGFVFLFLNTPLEKQDTIIQCIQAFLQRSSSLLYGTCQDTVLLVRNCGRWKLWKIQLRGTQAAQGFYVPKRRKLCFLSFYKSHCLRTVLAPSLALHLALS